MVQYEEITPQRWRAARSRRTPTSYGKQTRSRGRHYPDMTASYGHHPTVLPMTGPATDPSSLHLSMTWWCGQQTCVSLGFDMSRSPSKPTSLSAGFCVLHQTPLARHASVGIRSGNRSPVAGARQHAPQARVGTSQGGSAAAAPDGSVVGSAPPRKPAARPGSFGSWLVWPPPSPTLPAAAGVGRCACRNRHTANGHRHGAVQVGGSRGPRRGGRSSGRRRRNRRWTTGGAVALCPVRRAVRARPVRRLLNSPPSRVHRLSTRSPPPPLCAS